MNKEDILNLETFESLEPPKSSASDDADQDPSRSMDRESGKLLERAPERGKDKSSPSFQSIHREFLPTQKSLLADHAIPMIHRDLSWLQFNERVLAEAFNSSNPVLERAKFLAISASNLDEFFMIRVAALQKSSAQPLANVFETVGRFIARQTEAFELLSGELENFGIRFVRLEGFTYASDWDPLAQLVFENEVIQKLAPPEPYTPQVLLSSENLQTLAVFQQKVAFRIPKSIPQVLFRKGVHPSTGATELHLFFLDELLQHCLGRAFRLDGNPVFFRMTRDADFSLDLELEDPESIPEVVKTGIRSRDRGKPVRLQYSGEATEDALRQACLALKIHSFQALPVACSAFLSGLWTAYHQGAAFIEELNGALGVVEKTKKTLKYPVFSERIPPQLLLEESIFENISQGDILLHHPYDSFEGYVRWIQAAARDPQVTQIEQTVYRMDALSPVLGALKEAALSGKKVRVLIELRARFDELNNLAISEELRKAGIEIAFGFGKLKVHAKVALVTRMESGIAKLYTHLSTGNYHSFTSRQYTDLAILSAHSTVGEDAKKFFDAAFSGKTPQGMKALIPAPDRLHKILVQQIRAEREAALQKKKARIVAKVNALVDPEVIQELYLASQAGVTVDLIVRGACSLIPGVKGLSEKIRVISVVDRYLEHSRLYFFENSGQIFLSSADWMPRNFFSRLELAFPVTDPKIFKYLREIVIPVYLADTVKAHELTPQGVWKRRSFSSVKRYLSPALQALLGSERGIRSQQFFESDSVRSSSGSDS